MIPPSSSHVPGDDGTEEVGARLGRLFEALSDHAPASRLVRSLPQVQRRIAARRAAKIGGITVVATVVAGALAAGAWAASPWHLSEGPVQPAEPTPTLTSPAATPTNPTPTNPTPTTPTPTTPTPTPADTPAATTALEDSRFTDGKALPFANGLDDAFSRAGVCGGRIDDLLAHTDHDRVALEITGAIDQSQPERSGVAPARVTDLGAGMPSTYGAGDPILLWTQDGRIVDGSLWTEGGTRWQDAQGWGSDSPTWVDSLAPGQLFDTYAFSRAGWHCGPSVPIEGGNGLDYPADLPAGEYEVYAVTWYQPDVEDGTGWRYAASAPVTATVG